jgi:hypothetical protein
MQHATQGSLYHCLHDPQHPLGGRIRASDGVLLLLQPPGPGQLSASSLPPPAVLALLLRALLDAAEGMRAIHAAQMVHRDLKTHNLLVDVHGRVLVGDLGLTRRLQEHTGHALTEHAGAGTFAYMAPEVVRGEEVRDHRAPRPARWERARPRLTNIPRQGALSPACDVYAYGCVVWELFAGRQPWEGKTACQVALEVGAGRSVLAVCGAPRGMPPPLAQLAGECLHALPAQRPSFSGLVERLRALLFPLQRFIVPTTTDARWPQLVGGPGPAAVASAAVAPAVATMNAAFWENMVVRGSRLRLCCSLCAEVSDLYRCIAPAACLPACCSLYYTARPCAAGRVRASAPAAPHRGEAARRPQAPEAAGAAGAAGGTAAGDTPGGGAAVAARARRRQRRAPPQSWAGLQASEGGAAAGAGRGGALSIVAALRSAAAVPDVRRRDAAGTAGRADRQHGDGKCREPGISPPGRQRRGCSAITPRGQRPFTGCCRQWSSTDL